MTRIHTILPELKNQMGHIYEYALSVKKASEKNGWSHTASTPQDCEINPLPDGWANTLPPGPEINHFFAYRRAMRKNDILFLEHFRLPHLITLFFAFFFSRVRPRFWLLHRHSPREMKFGGKLHRLLYRIFSVLFGKKKLLFITDSELLKEEQELLFKREVHLVPIPHVHTAPKGKFPKPEGSIDCWWPGGATRETKGLRDICKISEELAKSKSALRLIVAKNSEAKGVKASTSVLFVEDELSRNDYEKWLETADIALLPYHSSVYHSATSGIFVETVCAGSIPVTKDHTWMAHELRRYDLAELILDWEAPDLLMHLERLPQNSMIREKLEKMRADYRQFHSLDSFAKSFEKMATRS